jgi:hypothetical protein
MEEYKLTKELFNQLDGSFDTHLLLDAVDALDAVRPIISDDYGEGGGIPRPPEIRDKLLELQRRSMELFNSEFRCNTDRGVFDLAWEIEDEIFEAIDSLEKIQEIISQLTSLAPDDEEG